MRHLGGDSIYLAPQEVDWANGRRLRTSPECSRGTSISSPCGLWPGNCDGVRGVLGDPGYQRAHERGASLPGAGRPADAPGKGREPEGFSIAFIGDGTTSRRALFDRDSPRYGCRMAAPKGYGLPEDVISESSAPPRLRGANSPWLITPRKRQRCERGLHRCLDFDGAGARSGAPAYRFLWIPAEQGVDGRSFAGSVRDARPPGAPWR